MPRRMMQPCGRRRWSCWAGLPTPLRPPSWPELLLRRRHGGTGSAVCIQAGPGGILGRVGGFLAGHPGQIPGHGGTIAAPSGRRQCSVPHPCGRSQTVSDHRRLGGLPHARHHGRPFGGATCRSKPRRLAAQLAIPRICYRERVLLPTLPPDHRALLRSQSGPHAGSWLAAIPGEAATTLSPEAMQVALRRRLRLPLPIASGRCGPSPGCGGPVDLLGDHALACPRTGLLARRAKVVERAWIRVAREAVGAESHIVPQPWLAHTTAPRVETTDCRRLDLLIYGATPNWIALCCDATLISPLTRTGQPQPCSADVDGAALRVAERRKRATYPELAAAGPQRLIVLGAEVGHSSGLVAL